MLSPSQPHRFAELSPPQARGVIGCLLLVAIIGSAASWNRGNLPRRGPVGSTAASPADLKAVAETPTANQAMESVSPDLQLYRDVVAKVGQGENYYVAARPELLKHGFPIRSTFNWRLPTYAWLFSLFPGPWAIQALVVMLAAAGLALHFQVELSARGLAPALISSFLMLGVVKWSVDGLAFYTQELWASVLILISLGAMGKGWRSLAVVAGIAALLFRELALPFCFWAALLAVYRRRWGEASAWGVGIALFFAFLIWHGRQVAAQLQPADLTTAGGGVSQWLKFGGLNFVLLTARLNAFLFAAPGSLLFLYLLFSLFGLASERDDRLTLQLFAAASYLAAFCFVGMDINFYWGLLYAPLLPAGMAAFPTAISILWQRSGLPATPPHSHPPPRIPAP